MSPRMCEAFVYGGGNMFPNMVTEPHVGDLNAHSVIDRLTRDGVRIVATDLGGRAYRRLRWTIGCDLPRVVATSV